MSLAAAPLWPFVPRGAPFQVARAEGVWLVTDDGRRILDAAGGAIVANVGHGRPEVARAVARELETASYVVPTFATESRLRLVRRLRERWLPPALTRVLFTSGGSESVDTAIRVARQHHVAAGRPGRWKVIGRDVSYHGATVSTLSVGGHAGRRSVLGPWLGDVAHAPACYCLRCPLGLAYPSCRVACAAEVEAVIEREGPETVAAFLAEPIVGSSGGALVPPDEYWPAVAEVCRRHDVLLIADEVMTGFGRTGARFALEHFALEPDILVGGKGLTGGYAPMGGVFATDAVVEPLVAAGEEIMFFTYGAHPAACAAADVVLDILERERLVERAAAMGERLRKRLGALEAHPHVAQVRGRGLLQAIEIVRDRATLEPFPASARLTARIVAAGLRRGVFFYPGGTGAVRDVIALGPPLVIGEEEIETMASVLEASLDEAIERVQGGPPGGGRTEGG
jgi:adenosylmethionine-8-amino-7-oxononanoate aminotransferase